MTVLGERPVELEDRTTVPLREPRGKIIVSWLTSTDHKVIGYMYILSSFGFFLFGGVLALKAAGNVGTPKGAADATTEAGLAKAREEAQNGARQ